MHFCAISNHRKGYVYAALICIAAVCLLFSTACANKMQTTVQQTPSGVDTSSAPPSSTSTPPTPAPLPATTLHIPKHGNIIPDDTAVMGTFVFAETQLRIMAPKSLLIREDGLNNKDLSGHDVYVHPIPIIDTESFVLVERAGLLPELGFTMHLINDEVRNAAVAALLSRGYSNITQDRVLLVPFGVLRFSARDVDGSWREVGVFPEHLNRAAIQASTPTSIQLQLQSDRGSLEKAKTTLTTLPRQLQVDYIVGGFTITQNIFHLGIRDLVEQGYLHDLTGTGAFRIRDMHSARGGSVAVNLGPFSFGDSTTAVERLSSNESEVSRAQVMQMMRRFVTDGWISGWREGDSDFIQHFADFFTGLASDSRKVDYSVVLHDGKYFLDVEGVQLDTRPDIYTAVGADAKARMSLGRVDRERTVTLPNGMRASANDATPEVNFETSGAPNNAGTIIIPKTHVQLFQFNKADFDRMMRFSVVDTVAEGDAREFSTQSVRRMPEQSQAPDPAPVEIRRFTRTITVGGGGQNINYDRQIMGRGINGADGELGSQGGRLIDYELLVWLERVNDRRYNIRGTFLAHERGFAAQQTKVGFHRGIIDSIEVPAGHQITRIPAGGRMMSGTQERHRTNRTPAPGAIHVAVRQGHHGGEGGWHRSFTAGQEGPLERGRYEVSFPANHIVRSFRFVGDGNGDDTQRVRASVNLDFEYEVTGPRPRGQPMMRWIYIP